MDDEDAADVDTDSYEVLSVHPFCRSLRKEVVLAISRASKRWVFTGPDHCAGGDCTWGFKMGVRMAVGRIGASPKVMKNPNLGAVY